MTKKTLFSALALSVLICSPSSLLANDDLDQEKVELDQAKVMWKKKEQDALKKTHDDFLSLLSVVTPKEAAQKRQLAKNLLEVADAWNSEKGRATRLEAPLPGIEVQWAVLASQLKDENARLEALASQQDQK